tara:strand:+ start:1253 stop:1615 length:363 start_codon:yes stop_codon:yes gene_type:complete
MKLLLSLTGTIFTSSFTLGFLFKIMYWPGANDLLWLGNIGVGLIFIPLLCFYYLKKANNSSLTKIKIVLGLFSSVLISSSVAMKWMHLQFASELFITGMLLISLVFIPLFFIDFYKKATH